MKYQDFKTKLMEDKEFRKEREKVALHRSITVQVFKLRKEEDLTQQQLADLIGTKQESISRLESGNRLPSLTLLKKIAVALRTKLVVKFEK